MPRQTIEEYQILKIIGESETPLGSGTISEKLRAMDIDISEATIGRCLRSLDSKGLTEKAGFQGRYLTDAGNKAVEEYEHDQDMRVKTNYFMRLAKAGAKEELLHILVARRAIEKETCRLAAEKASNEDLKTLAGIVDRHLEHIHSGMSGAREDTEFHKMIAKIGGNKFLAAALDLIRQDGQLSPVFEYIREKVGSTVVADHKKVLQALQERDPSEAEKTMADHLENVIADVKKYWSIVHETENPDGS